MPDTRIGSKFRRRILPALAGICLFAFGAGHAAGVRPVNKAFTVQDCGTPIEVLRLIGATVYKHPESGELHLFVEYGTNNGYGIGAHEWEDTSHTYVDINMKTGEQRRDRGSRIGGFTTAHRFHPDGNIYLFETKTKPAYLSRFDTRSGKYAYIANLGNTAYITRLAPSGRIYVGEVSGDVCWYDPPTRNYVRYIEPTGGKIFWGVYTMEVEEPWIYCGMTNRGQWWLTVIDTRTGEAKDYFREEEKSKGGVVRTEAGNIFFGKYLLKDGAPQMDDNGNPVPLPEPDKSKRLSKGRPWPDMWRISGYARNPYLEEREALGMEFDLASAEPNNWNNGVATIKWRKKGAEKWNDIVIENLELVGSSPKSLVIRPDGTFVGAGEFYGAVFAFDPKTGKSREVGNSPGSVYCMLATDDKVYMAGYVNYMAEWDPAQPYEIEKKQDWKKDVNPKRYRAGAKVIKHIIECPDGRIYMGGRFGRHHPGGGMGIFDPKTREMQILRKPWFEWLAVNGLFIVDDGKKLAIPTYPLTIGKEGGPEKGSLFLYDFAERKIVREVKLDFEANPEQLFVTPEGGVIGVSTLAEENRFGRKVYSTLVYGLDLESGKPTFEKRFKGKPFTSTSPYWSTELVRGPDGCGWLFVDEDLCRIHPDGELERIGKTEYRGKILWDGDTMYIYNNGRIYVRLFANVVKIQDLFATR